MQSKYHSLSQKRSHHMFTLYQNCNVLGCEITSHLDICVYINSRIWHVFIVRIGRWLLWRWLGGAVGVLWWWKRWRGQGVIWRSLCGHLSGLIRHSDQISVRIRNRCSSEEALHSTEAVYSHNLTNLLTSMSHCLQFTWEQGNGQDCPLLVIGGAAIR